MRSLSEIVEIIESESIKRYGSVNKMLHISGVSKSMVDNMKRETPSIPSMDKFCKITESLDLSLDYLLKGSINPFKSGTNNELSIDEKNIIDVYRDINNDGKSLVQTSIREIWAENRLPKSKLSNSSTDNMVG